MRSPVASVLRGTPFVDTSTTASSRASRSGPAGRVLEPEQVTRVEDLWRGTAEGNAVVVRDVLAAEGVEVSLRTIQRVVEPLRREHSVAQQVTTRFETEPGAQMQVDFGVTDRAN